MQVCDMRHQQGRGRGRGRGPPPAEVAVGEVLLIELLVGELAGAGEGEAGLAVPEEVPAPAEGGLVPAAPGGGEPASAGLGEAALGVT